MSETADGKSLYDRTDVSDATEEACGATLPASSVKWSSFVEVPLDDRLADNPINARHSIGELEGLEASIRARGLLQPLIVARAETFRSARQNAMVDTEAEWVLLAGHRRRAAARRAGIGTAIAIVRDDLVKNEDSATVALVENVHRAGLSPLEEARILSVLTDLGLSQREVSRQTGISQGQISKRLQLLDLPAELQDRIDDGGLAVTDALTILRELSDPQDQLRALRLSQDQGRSLKQVLSKLQRERAARNVVAEQAPSQGSNVSGEGPKEVDNDKRMTTHETACSARIEACRRAVQSRLSVEQIADVLVDAILDPPILQSAHAKDQAYSMAAEWTAAILPEDLDASAPSNMLLGTPDAARRLAVAIVLAHREIDLASALYVLQPWGAAARRHVRRLAAWGMHVESAYEHARLDEPAATRVAN